jgi:hypothetical protein
VKLTAATKRKRLSSRLNATHPPTPSSPSTSLAASFAESGVLIFNSRIRKSSFLPLFSAVHTPSPPFPSLFSFVEIALCLTPKQYIYIYMYVSPLYTHTVDCFLSCCCFCSTTSLLCVCVCLVSFSCCQRALVAAVTDVRRETRASPTSGFRF